MTEEEPVLEYDQNEVDVEYYREHWLKPNRPDEEEEMTDQEVREEAWQDRMYWQTRYDNFIRSLGDLLHDISQRNKFPGYFRVTVNDAGWRNQRGGKVIDVSNFDLGHHEAKQKAAEEFIQSMTPEGDWNAKVYRKRNKLRIVISHHDSPTGETYYARPLTAEEVRTYDREGERAILEDHKEGGSNY